MADPARVPSASVDKAPLTPETAREIATRETARIERDVIPLLRKLGVV